MIDLNTKKLKSLIKDLNSQKIDKQITAIEEIEQIIEFLVVKVVGTLEKSNDPFFVAQRLSCFGSIAVAPLEKLLTKSKKPEVSNLAALVLLGLGERSGVPRLLKVINKKEKYAYLAAKNLAAEGIRESIQPIVSLLRECNTEKVEEIITLLESLDDLDFKVPLDIYNRLNEPQVPWRIKFVLWNINNKENGYCNIDEYEKFKELFSRRV